MNSNEPFLENWILAVGSAAGIVVALGFAKQLLVRFLRKQTAKTETAFDDILIDSLSLPLHLLILLIALTAGQSFLRVPVRVEPYIAGFMKALFIGAIVLFADRFVISLFRMRQAKSDNVVFRSSSGLLQAFIHSIIFALGVLVLLDSLGVSITPILASLGVGSLAVALALQDTLANFFAGVFILIDRPLDVGHFVKLDNGDEGIVDKIGWRSTWIRTPRNTLVVIPNTKIAGSIFTNYARPNAEVSVPVEVGVSYESDLSKVEEIALAVARDVLDRSSQGVEASEPLVRFHTFGDSSVNFTVILRSKDIVGQGELKHDYIKALHARFALDGIEIPYRIQTLDIPHPVNVTIKREA